MYLLSQMDSLYRYAIVLSGDAGSASDLVLETYVRALRAQRPLRRDDLRGWLFTTLRDLCLKRPRGTGGLPELVDDNPAKVQAEIECDPRQNLRALFRREPETDQILDAVLRLPEDFGELIVLREYEQLSYREIALVLGCPHDAVISRLGKARARLRTLLGDM